MPNEEYRVEVETQPCVHCGTGGMWDVVDSTGAAATSTIYGSKDEAEEIARWMNVAFEAGQKRGIASQHEMGS